MRIMHLAVAGCLAALSGAAIAQDRVYDNGPVVAVSQVKVEPGQFNAYMADLNRVWRRSMEEGKKRGEVLSYEVLSNIAAGRDEPDIVLVVTYKNASFLDTSLDEQDQRTAALQGSTQAATQAQVARGKLRTIMGRELYRSLTFK